MPLPLLPLAAVLIGTGVAAGGTGYLISGTAEAVRKTLPLVLLAGVAYVALRSGK